jgi:hypothetical protein
MFVLKKQKSQKLPVRTQRRPQKQPKSHSQHCTSFFAYYDLDKIGAMIAFLKDQGISELSRPHNLPKSTP